MKITTTLSGSFLLGQGGASRQWRRRSTVHWVSPSPRPTTIQGESIPAPPPNSAACQQENAKDSKTWWPPHRPVAAQVCANVLLSHDR